MAACRYMLHFAAVFGCESMQFFFQNRFCRFLLISIYLGPLGFTQTEKISPDLASKIDAVAERELAVRGVPSASIAVVREGEIAYLHAYGSARIEPPVTARPEMRYSIGSVSKQFTAAAMLRLAEQGKLSLDDPVSRFVPDLTRAKEVTIRQLLSHTSGYQDYWPQDYVPPFMLKPVSAKDILDGWARKPLDFDPGTKWQYSNTNFVIAGLIIEQASGMPMFQFIQTTLFAPLKMSSVLNIDQDRLGDTDATGYMRYALGPARVAPKEGKGWLFAAGELAMTAEDLAKWDIALLNQSLLKPESARQMESQACLKNGLCTGYGLGIGVKELSGHRVWSHGGEVSGFTAHNAVFPDDKAAVIVLINQDSGGAASAIAQGIESLLFDLRSQATTVERDRKIFEGLQRGEIDRSQFTGNANSYFTDQAVKDFASSLGPLGKPLSFVQTDQEDRGGMTFHAYAARFAGRGLSIWVREMPNGKIEQYQVSASE
jgi:D-alanyl-D-alanine carboxypeptidase